MTNNKASTSSFWSGLKSAFSDIRLLLWKNFLIQWRHPILSVVEIVIPCFLVLLISIFRGSVEVTDYTEPIVYEPFNFNETFRNDTDRYVIMFTPNTVQNGQIAAETIENLRNIYFVTFKEMGFNSSAEMLDYYLTKHSDARDGKVICGVEFGALNEHKIDFTLRFPSVPRSSRNAISRQTWHTANVMPDISGTGPRSENSADGGQPGYAREGFLGVQHALSLAAAKVIHKVDSQDGTQMELEMSRFPYPPYIHDLFTSALSFFFPAIIMFSFIYPSVNITKNLVIEKEKRQKESMKMMGLMESYHWIAHFAKSLIWVLPTLVIITALMFIHFRGEIAILNHTNPFLLFLFFFIYQICNTCLCFLMSTLFSKANLAGIATGVLFFFTFIPFFTAVAQYSTLNHALKVVYCLLPNTNMAFGMYIISMLESRGVGLTWPHLNSVAVPNDNLTILAVFGMFLLDSVIFLLITWYITQAFPGEYGVPLPWYFPFTLKYWTGKDDESDGEIGNGNHWNSNLSESFEADPVKLRAGIEVQNMSKSYDGGKSYSVKNLSFRTYFGQITALLGHNGAGKTTTISILTGLFKPTSGTALVNGSDIRVDINTIRSSLGICPQFNVLFDELTVEEHLVFYSKLKKTNMTDAEIKQDVRLMIEKLDLMDKRKVQSCKLSGGMKRKLSVGIALIGGSKVVILDEPTSGMDVSARRFIWDLLLKEKRDRSILISTHFMEEADILGDRIAIMSEGALQCSGSPLFLKKRFGSGYHLTLAKSSALSATEAITEVIKSYVPNAQLESSVGVEVTYSLPDDDTEKFEPLLAKIESDKQMGVVNYGISVTTMEEVFLKVGEYAKDKIDSLTKTDDMIQIDLNQQEKSLTKNSGIKLWFQQLYALITKKLIYVKRSPFLLATQLLIPFAILNISMISIRSQPDRDATPALRLELSQFTEPQVRYFYDGASKAVADKYADSLVAQLGRSKVHAIENVDPNVIVKDIVSQDANVYNYQFMISAIFEQGEANVTKMIAMFNNQAYHTPAIALKYIDETLIRMATNQSDISISVTNDPLPLTTEEQFQFSFANSSQQYEIMQGIILGFAFLVGSFSVLLVKERVTKGKHLQKLSGVRITNYWLSYFIIDYSIYIIASILMVATFVIYKTDGLYQDTQAYYLFLGFVLHGLAVLPCIYVLSFMFEASASAYAKLCLYVTVIGIATVLADQITSVKELDLLEQNRIMKPFFSLFVPVYNCGKMAANLMQNYKTNEVCGNVWIQLGCSLPSPPHQILPCCKGKCNDTCVAYEPNNLSINEPGIGLNILYTMACAAIYMALLIVIETNLLNYLRGLIDQLLNKHYYAKSNNQVEFSNGDVNNNGKVGSNKNQIVIDEDVNTEKKRIDNIDLYRGDNPLVVKNLLKRYGKFVAVKRISYAVGQGECFGMLGVNGAGKTTTFKMITGDEPITDGDIFVNGMDLRKDIRRIQQEMGYCPQFDAVLEDLTGRETLTMYSRLRGIREDQIGGQIVELSRLLYFDMHLDKLVGKYSGGNKRKLSTAIALLGNPSISFLDEPTTGVDPVARRCLWEAIGKKMSQGCSVVLTSHSMEECEALCNRLIIMVNGQITCIGSPLQLKNKFGNGYSVQIRVAHSPEEDKNQENIAQIENFVRSTFPRSVLKEVHNNMMHFEIEGTLVKCSEIFGSVERARRKLNIEDYSVCQTNLEQIFLSFARHQQEETI